MNNLRLPSIDSATFRGIMTAFQALITFWVGFILAIWQVPGVPKAAMDFVWNNTPQTLLAFGVPLIIGTGITSFIINWLFRVNIKTY